MVHGGTEDSHKCLGAQGSQISYNAFTLKERDAISVHIRMDNMTALLYLMKMGRWGWGWVGGTENQELTAISKEIW